MNTRFSSLADIPRHYAARQPARIALQCEDRQTRYAEWDRLCSQAANGVAALGLKPGSRIGYLGKNSDRFFHLLFGGAKAGTALVPLNWRLAVPEIAFILQDAGCELLFVGADFVPLLPEIRRACPALRHVIGVDGEVPAAAGGGEALASFDAWLARQPAEDPRHDVATGDVVLQLYTSGTTGLPKGAQLTHGNLLFSMAQGATPLLGEWREDDVSVLPLPLFHAGGVVYGLNGPYAGCTTVVVREAAPALILAALRTAPAPATRLGVVPAVLQMLLDHPDFGSADFGSLRTMTYGGSPITPAVLRRAIQAIGPVLVQLFGMTETATVGTALLPADHDPDRPARLASCGRALPGVELRVVRIDGQAALPGESGEVLVRCGAVMRGYWNRPEASEAALQGGWYHTGDVGYLDSDGYLSIQDRLKDMIITGGENVYPAEVERVLADHPAVADVAVIGVPDDKWGEAVKAVVVLRAGPATTQDQLIAFARERIAGYKCPKSVDVVAQLPRNASGKLLKRVLREPYWVGRSRAVG